MPHMKMPRFQMAVKVTTGKGFSNFGKAATGKDFSNFGKGKDPFLSQERSSLQLGKVSVILGKERILSFPRMVKRKASKGERKGFRPSQDSRGQNTEIVTVCLPISLIVTVTSAWNCLEGLE